MPTRAKRTTAGDKTICLPIGNEIDYETLVKDTKAFRVYLDHLIDEHPELFPREIDEGYCFHGFVESQRLELTTRRLRLKHNGQVYQLRPDTVMPYMVGTSEEVEKGLYLRRYGVPYVREAFPKGRDCPCVRTLGNVLVASDAEFRENLACGDYGQRAGGFSPLTWWPMRSILGGGVSVCTSPRLPQPDVS
jgi:hypothetical protein